MGDIIELQSIQDNELQENTQPGILEVSAELLSEARSAINNKKTISIPLGQLSSLGAGVSSLIPAFRTVTETTTINTTGLYQLANEVVGDKLKQAQNGNFWGAFKTADGKSKFAQLKAADPISVTNTVVAPINPAMIMMAASLASVEKKVEKVIELEKQILSTLANEKKSKIEGDLQTINAIIIDYKHNWDNEHFIRSNHKMSEDLKRTARSEMISYQKKIEDMLAFDKFLISNVKVQEKLSELLDCFNYYRMTLYTFALSSMVEVMLSGNFREENITSKKAEIEANTQYYGKLYDDVNALLEKLSGKAIEGKVMRGAARVGTITGSVINKIPVVNKGPVDELLMLGGAKLFELSDAVTSVSVFEGAKNPHTDIFVEKMDDMIQIYNHTDRICFDNENVYLMTKEI